VSHIFLCVSAAVILSSAFLSDSVYWPGVLEGLGKRKRGKGKGFGGILEFLGHSLFVCL
jgi:hypothetical protein